jgi:glycosyltransferase involved in cell wall biosynthesis
LRRVRILIDYRPALRSRTGAGEYIHQLARALIRTNEPRGDEIAIFTSSWGDRPRARDLADLPGVRLIDRRVPVRVLNLLWHRAGWPPVESLTDQRFDVVHSPHPLLIPSRAAAQVVTIHDLDFLAHPERTRAEIHRDYARLAPTHARRAQRVIVPSRYTAGEVQRRLQVPSGRIAVCYPGAPDWLGPLDRPKQVSPEQYILFVGTLGLRKNIGTLLEAYATLTARLPAAPRLRLAGHAPPEAEPWLLAIADRPLAGHVEHVGYVPDDERRKLFEGARMLVLPSYEEGFGMPVLEAMALGMPVVVSTRGALPEVVGDAGIVVEPDDVTGLAAAMERLVADRPYAAALGERAVRRARTFSWESTAATVRAAYGEAIAEREREGAGGKGPCA